MVRRMTSGNHKGNWKVGLQSYAQQKLGSMLNSMEEGETVIIQMYSLLIIFRVFCKWFSTILLPLAMLFNEE